MNATTYRLASKAAGTGARTLRPATRVSAFQRIQARPFSGTHRVSQNAMHLPKEHHHDTAMWMTFGTVGVSAVLGMWYSLSNSGVRMSGHFRVRDMHNQEILDQAAKQDLPRL